MGGSLAEMLQGASDLANSGRDAESIDAYNRVISEDPENATAWYCLGVLHSRAGSTEEAVQSFERSDRSFPNHGPTLANLATLLEGSDPRKASEYATAAMVSLPGDPNISRIAQYEAPAESPPKLFVQAKAVEAEQEVALDDSMGDSSPESRMGQAEALTSSGDHSSAVAIWKSLLEEAPNSPAIWRGLGEALFSAGYPDRADQCRKRAESIEMDANPEEEPLPEESSVEDLNHDDTSDALMIAVEEAQSRQLQEEPRSDLEDAIGWYNMGINLMNEGKHDEALSSFEKAIGGCPPDEVELKVKSQNARGNALYNSERYSESVIAYHTAIGLDPKGVQARTLFNMGSSYAAVELFEDAIKCFTQAISMGLDKEEADLCEKQLSRCRLLAREQSKRQSRL